MPCRRLTSWLRECRNGSRFLNFNPFPNSYHAVILWFESEILLLAIINANYYYYYCCNNSSGRPSSISFLETLYYLSTDSISISVTVHLKTIFHRFCRYGYDLSPYNVTCHITENKIQITCSRHTVVLYSTKRIHIELINFIKFPNIPNLIKSWWLYSKLYGGSFTFISEVRASVIFLLTIVKKNNNYEVRVFYNGIMFIPNFVKIGPLVQKQKREIHAHRRNGDLINIIFFFSF